MELCYDDMSTRLKQRAVIEFLSAENVTPTEIHRRLQAVYGEHTVDRTTVNRWAIKFRECEPGLASIVDQPCNGRPVSMTDDKHQKQVDELIKHDTHITQKQIACRLVISKERVGYIIALLGYTKVCSRWVPHVLTPENKQKYVECCEELLKLYCNREYLFRILLLEMSHGFIIFILKKNDRAWNTGTLHLLVQKHSKRCCVPERFF
jgi:transposase